MKKTLSWVFLLALVSMMALAAAPVFGGNGNGIEKANQAQEKVNKKALSNKDVVGTSVGLDADGEAVVRVFTAKSGVGGIPKEQDGVKIVAQVTGPINALGRASAPVLIPSAQSTTDRWPRPVPIGVSTGHPDITAGTIGARVKDSAGNIFALSNNHVYADENQASIGYGVIQLAPTMVVSTRPIASEPSPISNPSFFPHRPATQSTQRLLYRPGPI